MSQKQPGSAKTASEIEKEKLSRRKHNQVNQPYSTPGSEKTPAEINKEMQQDKR